MSNPSLVCPYNNCGKKFGKLIMLTDATKIPRDTYYACPHCKTQIDVLVEGRSLFSIERHGNGKEAPPMGCPFHYGYLSELKQMSKDFPTPKECLACPQITDCLLNDLWPTTKWLTNLSSYIGLRGLQAPIVSILLVNSSLSLWQLLFGTICHIQSIDSNLMLALSSPLFYSADQSYSRSFSVLSEFHIVDS